MTNIKTNYDVVLKNICSAAKISGIDPEKIKIVTVTKMREVNVIKSAISAGLRYFGENYPEQAVPKIKDIADQGIEWHMIGHIQSRKTKIVASYFNFVHSIDRLKIARLLNNELSLLNKHMPVLLEFNMSGEESKFGFPAFEASNWGKILPDIELMVRMENLSIKGLMTMPPLCADGSSRKYFIMLRKLQEYLSKKFGAEYFEQLSMGTSVDYPIAVEEGATMVRIGEAILGSRKKL